MSTLLKFSVLATVAVVLLASCGSTRTVSRVSADTQVDLSGRWNDTDAQQSAEALVTDVLKRAWLSDFTAKMKKKPTVIVGQVRNRSDEHIETLVITKSLEKELINSGKVSFVAAASEREGVRNERTDQQGNASENSAKALGKETGADFMLRGDISSVVDAVEGQRVVFYKVNLELINIETNEKVWVGDKQIKKIVEQSKTRL